MSSVQDYRQRLAALQNSWDTLSLLSHLSGDGTDMGGTRQAFETLTSELMRNLGVETHRKALLGLKAKGQIAIDIMVRNLYERTADIGFLSTDEDIRAYLAAREALPPESSDAKLRALDETLRARFREYVAKYSVYHDVILLAPDGTVLLRLDDQAAVDHSSDPLIATTLTTRDGYVETFRRSDLLPRQARGLIYSSRVTDAGRPIGVLCLCFRFEDEVNRIFAKLQEEGDWTLFALLDQRGNVIASSDRWQLPLAAPLALCLQEDGGVVRFAGREYLAITRKTQGYQGYQGPGWYGQAMIPVEHAFDHRPLEVHARIPEQMLAQLRDSAVIFSEELRRIPRQADEIQRDLNRAVWNSNVRLGQRTDDNGNFAKVLLWEIGNAGRRTQETFDLSILDLQETVISSIFDDAELLAALAVDVLDRNLYERANDCRWWALERTFAQALNGDPAARSQVGAILKHINGLYTVYHNIVLFDAQRRCVAASAPTPSTREGTVINEDWAVKTLNLRGSHDYTFSEFQASPLYENRHTLTFGAAVRHAGKVLGGIGIVFDAKPQLTAMLRDALPRSESGEASKGSLGLFVDQDMRVIAATSRYQPGDTIALSKDLLRQTTQAGTRIVSLDGISYALGARRTAGYREYRGLDAFALILVPLGEAAQAAVATSRFRRSNAQRQGANHEEKVDIATFRCIDQRLGLLRHEVVEAVDGSSLRSVPGSPPWHAGLLMYRDSPVLVIDLARLLEKAAANGDANDVVIARVPSTGQLIGLLIDELGDIPEVSVNRILPFTERAQHNGAAVIDRAVRPESPEEPVLFIVNIEQLVLHTQTGRSATTLL